jgi:hypothetical protein
MVARSHHDMETRSHTIRRTSIPSTGRRTIPAVFGATAADGAAITGTATIGTVEGTADMEVEADMVAAADTLPWLRTLLQTADAKLEVARYARARVRQHTWRA